MVYQLAQPYQDSSLLEFCAAPKCWTTSAFYKRAGSGQHLCVWFWFIISSVHTEFEILQSFESLEDSWLTDVFTEGKRGKKCFSSHCHLVCSQTVQSITLVSKQGTAENLSTHANVWATNKKPHPRLTSLNPTPWQHSHFWHLLWVCYFLFQIPELSLLCVLLLNRSCRKADAQSDPVLRQSFVP